MDNNDDRRQRLLLDMTDGTGAQSLPDPAAHLLQPWLRLANHLIPLIGESGFCALYGRAARLVVREFDWLAANQSTKSMGALLAALRDTLLSVDPALAATGNAALLTTFTQLLSSLIGEALTNRLVVCASQGEHDQKEMHRSTTK